MVDIKFKMSDYVALDQIIIRFKNFTVEEARSRRKQTLVMHEKVCFLLQKNNM